MRTKKEPANQVVTQTKEAVITKPVIKEPVSLPKVKPVIKSVTQKTANEPVIKHTNTEPTLVIKSGATDLRRGSVKLITDNITKMGNPNNGDILAYANKPKTTVKVIMKKPESTSMVTVHHKMPIDWPEYQPKDQPGHTITLEGKEKTKFLKDIGCPENL